MNQWFKVFIGATLFFLCTQILWILYRFFRKPPFYEGFSETQKKTWAIIQYDDRPLTPSFQKLQEKVKAYCEKHGYEHIFSTESYDIPPYWRKVKLANEVLEKGQHKGILWLDTDAVIHDTEKPIDSLLKEGKSFYYSPDSPKWSSNFNAGVWMVLGNPHGKEIVREWMSEYKADQWKKEDDGKKWTSEGTWGGESYEQGAFSNKILQKHKDKLEEFPWQVLQDDSPNASSFTLHFAGPDKDERITNYFKS